VRERAGHAKAVPGAAQLRVGAKARELGGLAHAMAGLQRAVRHGQADAAQVRKWCDLSMPREQAREVPR
jgi:hypothetical protein